MSQQRESKLDLGDVSWPYWAAEHHYHVFIYSNHKTKQKKRSFDLFMLTPFPVSKRK